MKLSMSLVITGILAGSMAMASPDGKGKTLSKQGMAVVIAFPEKDIQIPTDPSIWNKMARLVDLNRDDHWKVGHAGVLLIDKESRKVQYFDFGRYDNRVDLLEKRPENYGVVRSSETVPELQLSMKAQFNNGILSNLDSLLIHLAVKPMFKSYGRIEAAIYDHLFLDKMKTFINDLSQKGYVEYGCPTKQYCSRFVRQVIRKGGGRYSIGTYTGMQMVKWNRKNL